MNTMSETDPAVRTYLGLTETKYIVRLADNGFSSADIQRIVNEIWGNDTSLESIRHLLAEEGYPNKHVLLERNSIIPEVRVTEEMPNAQTIQRTLQYERDQKNALAQQLRQARRELVHEEGLANVLEHFGSSFPRMPEPHTYVTPRQAAKDVAFFPISDIHLGEWIKPEAVLGLEEYNLSTFCDRAQFYTQYVTDVLSQTPTPPSKIVVPVLGDNVVGRIHDELIETAEGTLIEQVYHGAKVLSYIIGTIARFAPTDVYFIPGNHGRLTRLRRHKQKYDNYDMIMGLLVSEMCSNLANVQITIPKSGYALVTYCGKKFLMLHGEQVPHAARGGRVLNWLTNLTESFAQHGRRDDIPDYVLAGHLHSILRSRSLIINGAWLGGDEYVLDSYGRISVPEQVYVLVKPEEGVSCVGTIPLSLAHKGQGEELLTTLMSSSSFR